MSKDEKKDEFAINDEEIFTREELPLEYEIIETSNFDELYDLIEEKKGIAGTKQEYKAEYLMVLIDEFRKIFKKLIETASKENPGEKTDLLKIFFGLSQQLNKITRKEELRFKVLQLAIREIKREGGD